FNSHPLRGEPPYDAYVQALLEDLEEDLPWVEDRVLQSLYLGGGTPSLFPPEAIAALLAGIRARLPCRPDLEVTLEANPGTVDAARFAAFRDAGVNRLSIGVQSFDDARLAGLGRIHDGGEARAAVEAAQAAGFERINLDLMHGLPGQDVEGALADLETALAFAPGHLSWYQLTIEPHTAFHRQPPTLPDEDTAWAIREAGLARLRAAGYEHYEVSAHARAGQACRHNLNYWQFGDYLGIGAGAHGKLTLAGTGRVLRTVRVHHPEAWLAAPGRRKARTHRLSDADLLFEYLLNRLRLTEPFSREAFEAATGLAFETLAPKLERACAEGLLEALPGQRYRPSPLGARFLDDLTARFLPD
ncbi:MAG: radical SAM family heme chaperone HemW, partial [Gammaproteobacteria bacterium]